MKRTLFVLLLSATSLAQCPVPQPTPPAPGANMFSDEQEMILGDLLATKFAQSAELMDGAEVEYLQKIGDRLMAQMPPTKLRFRFHLLDSGEMNGFSIPGGHVYITRKLISIAKSEDEIAGVIGHEIGHGFEHHSAVDYSTLIRKILKVNSVGDRDDIYRLYQELLETESQKHVRLASEAEEQGQADHVGLIASIRAGYRPQALPEFWDRVMESKGKTGGFFSDLFGTTKPSEVRLRNMLKFANGLPRECLEAAHPPQKEFEEWQRRVRDFSPASRQDRLTSGVQRIQINDPVRNDLIQLRYSPDGKRALAQDENSIFVLKRDPLQLEVAIDSPGALPASFTPDSQGVVFHTPSLRVEKWEIDGKRRDLVKELYVAKDCYQTALAPDARFLACYTTEGDLKVLHVEDDTEAFIQKGFYKPLEFSYVMPISFTTILRDLMSIASRSVIAMQFTRDGSTLAAGHGQTNLALDLRSLRKIPLQGDLGKMMGYSFDFDQNGDVVGVNQDNPGKSERVEFPSGRPKAVLKLGRARVSAATHGDKLLMRPLEKYPVGVFDPAQDKLIMANRVSPLDVWDGEYLSESRAGEVGRVDLKSNAKMATTMIPNYQLSRAPVLAASPDLRYVAYSQLTRGGVFDTQTGQRLQLVRGFKDATFNGDDVYFDFPRFQKEPRDLVQISLTSREVIKVEQITRPTRMAGAFQIRLLGKPIEEKKKEKKGDVANAEEEEAPDIHEDLSKDVTVEVSETASGKKLWSRPFKHGAPEFFAGEATDYLVFDFGLGQSDAKDIIKATAELQPRAAAMGNKDGDHLLQIVDLHDGHVVGYVFVESGRGKVEIERLVAAGNTLVFADDDDRVLLYSLPEGKRIGWILGQSPMLSRDGKWMVVRTGRRGIVLYDTRTLSKVGDQTFARPVSGTRFGSDGSRLMVLTKDQGIYMVPTAGGDKSVSH